MITQKNILTLGFALALAAAAPCFANTSNNQLHAQESGAPDSAAAAQAAVEPDAVPANSGYSSEYQLALSYSGIVGKIRSKNVQSVTHPSTGVFCIESKVSLDLTKIYPLVSVEWGESLGNSLLAFWRDTSIDSDCPSGWLEVQTFSFSGGAAVASNEVAFDLVIQ